MGDYKRGKKLFKKSTLIYREHYNLVLYTGEEAKNICKEIESRIIEKTEGLIIRLSIQITNEFISNFPKLKFIGSPTTGITHDKNIFSIRDLSVITLRDCMSKIKGITATGEHTVGLMLALGRSTTRYHNSVIYDHKWERELYLGSQLSNKTIGIIGLEELENK